MDLLPAALALASTVAGLRGGTGQERFGPPASQKSEPRASIQVVVLVGADDEALRHVVGTAKAQLASQGVELTTWLSPQDFHQGRAEFMAAHRVDGIFWFEHDEKRLSVFLQVSEGDVFTRQVSVDASSPQVTLEAVWLIVEAGSLTLASGGEVAMHKVPMKPKTQPEPQPQPKPEPQPEPLESRPSPSAVKRYLIDLGYEGGAYAKSVPWQSGLGVGFFADLGRLARVGARVTTHFPWRAGNPPVTWRHSLVAGAGVHVPLAERLEWNAVASGGVELVQWRSTTGAERGVRGVGLAELHTGLRVRVQGRWSVHVGVGARGVLNRFDFVACDEQAQTCDAAARRVVLRPWRFRPQLRVGGGVRF